MPLLASAMSHLCPSRVGTKSEVMWVRVECLGRLLPLGAYCPRGVQPSACAGRLHRQSLPQPGLGSLRNELGCCGLFGECRGTGPLEEMAHAHTQAAHGTQTSAHGTGYTSHATGGATTNGPDATTPPAICQNSEGGGGGGLGGGRIQGPGPAVPRVARTRSTAHVTFTCA